MAAKQGSKLQAARHPQEAGPSDWACSQAPLAWLACAQPLTLKAGSVQAFTVSLAPRFRPGRASSCSAAARRSSALVSLLSRHSCSTPECQIWGSSEPPRRLELSTCQRVSFNGHA